MLKSSTKMFSPFVIAFGEDYETKFNDKPITNITWITSHGLA